MMDKAGNYKSLDLYRALIMARLEKGKVYDTATVVRMIKECGIIPELDSKMVSLVFQPLYKYGFLKVVGWKSFCKSHYYEFEKMEDYHSVDIRIRWMPNHNDVWLWERLVDGVIVDQRLNFF